MAEPTQPAAPEGETEVTNTNLNQPAEQSAPQVNLHGFTEDQLGDLAKFMKGQGGFEAFKARMSNPEKFNQPAPQSAQPVQEQPTSQPQPSSTDVQPQQPQSQPTQPEVPKGYAKPQELLLEQYFDRLSTRPEYANISKDIANGNVIKEMVSMGMNPIDDNFNVNTTQLEQFLKLKSASVPAVPTETALTNIPTVDFTEIGENITDVNQALRVLEESRIAKAKGLAEHPSVAKAEEFLKKAWSK